MHVIVTPCVTGRFSHIRQATSLLSKTHVKIHVSLQGFSNVTFDWPAAMLPANQNPGLAFFC